MSDAVSWVLHLALHEVRADTFRELMREMVAQTRDEPGTQVYEWYIDPAGKTCHLHETYADSAAALAHLQTFGKRYAARFFACGEVQGLWVRGNPSDAARKALAAAGAQFLEPIGGFRR